MGMLTGIVFPGSRLKCLVKWNMDQFYNPALRDAEPRDSLAQAPKEMCGFALVELFVMVKIWKHLEAYS